ncbi:uncharacterized protein JN550_011237 [Neoarthrinium moseri]|uniref:uncharacterized protein n=1 Tax=Neoarthrinium moseri TaxID=1658444 RepID=UPI001FDCEB48|nr:uncharacterized protein JN550_011237 [Neoarthrinium moseri]KAI1860775.1 hypothetical protein JN550_011237 [Neoarthrinium moseri]
MPAQASKSKKSREVDNDVLRSPAKDAKVRKRVVSKPQADRLGNWNYTHELPTGEQRVKNGRLPGRTLVHWSRPFMMEKALLNLLYECDVQGIELPLDHVAHRLWPGASGEALRQRCERVRTELLVTGHLVPPKNRRGQQVSNLTRGVVRASPGDPNDLKTTRDVPFTEPFDENIVYDDAAFTYVHNRSSRKEGKAPGVNRKFQHGFLKRVHASQDIDELEGDALNNEDEDDAEDAYEEPEDYALHSGP